MFINIGCSDGSSVQNRSLKQEVAIKKALSSQDVIKVKFIKLHKCCNALHANAAQNASLFKRHMRLLFDKIDSAYVTKYRVRKLELASMSNDTTPEKQRLKGRSRALSLLMRCGRPAACRQSQCELFSSIR